MKSALLDDLLQAYTASTPANPAIAANRNDSCRLQDGEAACEELRIPANATPDSQTFAAIRNPLNGPESNPACGSSQDSQHSQGCSPGKGACTDDGTPRFLQVKARLLRWGWPDQDAHATAHRLTLRDRTDDNRVACAECGHYRPHRCGNHRDAGLQADAIGRELAALLQHCRGFSPAAPHRLVARKGNLDETALLPAMHALAHEPGADIKADAVLQLQPVRTQREGAQ